MKKLQLKKWKCRENDIEAVHNNKGYAYQRKLDKLEEVRKSYYPIKRAIDLILSIVLLCKNAEKNGAQWADKDDDRITNVGKFIRKTRIDELPQLINVVKGEMSFIGPRPERPEFVELFSSEVIGFEQRCLVTPGLTGLAQIQGGYDLTPQQKLKYDMKYIHKGSLMMELYISIRTLMVVITGEGSR